MAQKSKYATKVELGKQMNGPGCCAHKVTDKQIATAKAEAWERSDWRSHQRRPAGFQEQTT